MDQIPDTIVFFAIALMYPTISGPLAAYLYVLALKRDDSRLMLAFWTSLFIVHFAVFFIIVGNPGRLLTPGIVSCLVTTVFAASTALGLRIASHRLSDGGWEDPTRRKWLRIGIFLIPVMQVSTLILALLFAPSL